MAHVSKSLAMAALTLLAASCKKVECMQCIVENNAGMIIENRVYCESYDAAGRPSSGGLGTVMRSNLTR